MKEYDLYVPCSYDDGSTVEPEKFERLRERLLDQFGGFDEFPQPHKGLWKMAHVTFRGEVIVFRVNAKKKRARPFFAQLKEELKTDWRQEDILIVEAERSGPEGVVAGERV